MFVSGLSELDVNKHSEVILSPSLGKSLWELVDYGELAPKRTRTKKLGKFDITLNKPGRIMFLVVGNNSERYRRHYKHSLARTLIYNI